MKLAQAMRSEIVSDEAVFASLLGLLLLVLLLLVLIRPVGVVQI